MTSALFTVTAITKNLKGDFSIYCCVSFVVKSSPYFYSKKYLKHFITKLLEVELQLKETLKVAIMIPPTLRSTSAWGSRGWTVLCCGLCCTHRDYWSPEGVWRDIFELPAKAGSQGLAWAPCPGQPHSGPPFTRTPSRRPSRVQGAVQSTTGSSRLLWATEWVESLWLLLVSPSAGVLPPQAS